MTDTLGSKGANSDIVIKQGSTLSFVCTLTNDDSSPVNLTNCTLRGQIRKNASSALTVAFSFTVTNAAQGQFTFGLTDTQTAALAADMITEDAYASLYDYDIELVDSSNNVIPLMYGKAKVFREITKA